MIFIIQVTWIATIEGKLLKRQNQNDSKCINSFRVKIYLCNIIIFLKQILKTKFSTILVQGLGIDKTKSCNKCQLSISYGFSKIKFESKPLDFLWILDTIKKSALLIFLKRFELKQKLRQSKLPKNFYHNSSHEKVSAWFEDLSFWNNSSWSNWLCGFISTWKNLTKIKHPYSAICFLCKRVLSRHTVLQNRYINWSGSSTCLSWIINNQNHLKLCHLSQNN